MREGVDLYALTAPDLLDVVDSFFHDEMTEARTFALLGGTPESTRSILYRERNEAVTATAPSATSMAAVQASRAAESLMGGPAR